MYSVYLIFFEIGSNGGCSKTSVHCEHFWVGSVSVPTSPGAAVDCPAFLTTLALVPSDSAELVAGRQGRGNNQLRSSRIGL